MTAVARAAARKAAERRRRADRGEVALSGWLSAEDHAALVAMAREAGMTQGQVVSRLIGMRARLKGLSVAIDVGGELGEEDGLWVRHSDLTAAVGLAK